MLEYWLCKILVARVKFWFQHVRYFGRELSFVAIFTGVSYPKIEFDIYFPPKYTTNELILWNIAEKFYQCV